VSRVAHNGAEVQEAVVAALPLEPGAKLRNRVVAGRPAEVHRVQHARAPHVRAEAVEQTTPLARLGEAAVRARTARPHRVAGRDRELQRRRRAKYARSEKDRRLQAQARHGNVRRSPRLTKD
jgi:hypothetical protein